MLFYIKNTCIFILVQHINALQRNKERKQQIFITSQISNSRNVFFEDLCNAFVAANIPLHKLGNHVLKSFLEKHTGKSIPDESTLRKNYIPNIYKSVMDQIISDIGNNYVYIIVDETTDPRGLYKYFFFNFSYNKTYYFRLGLSIANLLIGKLDGTPSKSYLVACKELESTNYETICQFINSSLKIFPGIEQKVLLLISDAGTYMIIAAKTLKIFFPKLIHITCMAHAVNRVLEKIRELYPDINKLINNGNVLSTYLKFKYICNLFCLF